MPARDEPLRRVRVAVTASAAPVSFAPMPHHDELFQAIDAHDRMTVERLLKEPRLQHGARRNGRTPLHVAVETAPVSIVLALLQSDPELNARTGGEGMLASDPRTGWTALHLAAARGNRQIVELLVVQPQLDVTARTPAGETAAVLADRAQRPAIADAIREAEERSLRSNRR